MVLGDWYIDQNQMQYVESLKEAIAKNLCLTQSNINPEVVIIKYETRPKKIAWKAIVVSHGDKDYKSSSEYRILMVGMEKESSIFALKDLVRKSEEGVAIFMRQALPKLLHSEFFADVIGKTLQKEQKQRSDSHTEPRKGKVAA